MKTRKVVLFELDSNGTAICNSKVFECIEHAEQWILNRGNKTVKYIILPIYVQQAK